jgi:amidophosphoribosyltransferase
MTVDEMREFIRVDSLGFLSLDGLYRAAGEASRNSETPQYCDACFSGQYPTRLTDHEDRDNIRSLALLTEAKG